MAKKWSSAHLWFPEPYRHYQMHFSNRCQDIPFLSVLPYYTGFVDILSTFVIFIITFGEKVVLQLHIASLGLVFLSSVSLRQKSQMRYCYYYTLILLDRFPHRCYLPPFLGIYYFNALILLNQVLHLCCFYHIIFTNPSARAGYDTRSIFKRSLTGLNSEFSFS